MKCHSRYTVKELAAATLFVTFHSTCAAWLTRSLCYVEPIVKHGISLGAFRYLALLLPPSFLTIVLPIALFSSPRFSHNKLRMDRELVVLRAVGVSQLTLGAPAVAMAGVVMPAGSNRCFLPLFHMNVFVPLIGAFMHLVRPPRRRAPRRPRETFAEGMAFSG
jgi:lipopolysaccharide export system permease protein